MADFTFNEAVEVVRLCQRVSLDGGHNLTDYAVNYYARSTPDRLEVLRKQWVPSSKTDRDTFDAVNRIAQDHLRAGATMSRELAEWVADRLEGTRQRPAKPGASKGAKAPRDRLIASVVQALVDRGFRATRNPRLPMKTARAHASAEGGSACDAVGVALGMGYKAVEKVWTNSDPSARELLRNDLNDLFASYEMQRNK